MPACACAYILISSMEADTAARKIHISLCLKRACLTRSAHPGNASEKHLYGKGLHSQVLVNVLNSGTLMKHHNYSSLDVSVLSFHFSVLDDWLLEQPRCI